MITSTSNPRIKLVRALQTRRSEREQEHAFVIEGIRLAREAVRAQVPARLVLHTEQIDARGHGLVNSLARLGAEIQVVTPAVMAACSATESPPGLLAVVDLPERPLPSPLTFALVIDGLGRPRQPRDDLAQRLGFRHEAIFLSDGTVDPFNPKVVRAGMGAHFDLPICAASPGTSCPKRSPGCLCGSRRRVPAVCTMPASTGAHRSPSSLAAKHRVLARSCAVENATGLVHIPMRREAESLERRNGCLDPALRSPAPARSAVNIRSLTGFLDPGWPLDPAALRRDGRYAAGNAPLATGRRLRRPDSATAPRHRRLGSAVPCRLPTAPSWPASSRRSVSSTTSTTPPSVPPLPDETGAFAAIPEMLAAHGERLLFGDLRRCRDGALALRRPRLRRGDCSHRQPDARWLRQSALCRTGQRPTGHALLPGRLP